MPNNLPRHVVGRNIHGRFLQKLGFFGPHFWTLVTFYCNEDSFHEIRQPISRVGLFSIREHQKKTCPLQPSVATWSLRFVMRICVNTSIQLSTKGFQLSTIQNRIKNLRLTTKMIYLCMLFEMSRNGRGDLSTYELRVLRDAFQWAHLARDVYKSGSDTDGYPIWLCLRYKVQRVYIWFKFLVKYVVGDKQSILERPFVIALPINTLHMLLPLIKKGQIIMSLVEAKASIHCLLLLSI